MFNQRMINQHSLAALGLGVWLLGGFNARAGDAVFPVVGPQPLVDGGSSLLDALAPLCGSTLASSADAPGTARFEMVSCDLVMDFDRGVLHIDTLISRTWSYSPPSAKDVADRQLADLALLESIGFDVTEFGWVQTRQFAGQDRDDASGTVGAVRHMGTKTIIDRAILGVPVLGGRVVVTRDAAGSVARITAAWPTLATDIEVEVSRTADMTDDEAGSFTSSPVLGIQQVLVLGEPVDGGVRSARVCTEVTRLATSGDGETKPSAFYVMDGMLFVPTEDW